MVLLVVTVIHWLATGVAAPVGAAHARVARALVAQRAIA